MKHPRHAVVALATFALLASPSWAAENSQTVKGRIQEVHLATRQLEVTTDQGKELTLRVDEGTKLERNGKEVSLDQFQKGMPVKVVFESRDGQNRVVSMTRLAASAEQVGDDIRET